MTASLLALVLFAALLHAAWNAVLKSGTDRFRGIVIMSLASATASMPALFILPLPERASWGPILVSAAIHVAYNLFLVGAYRHGDLGQVYPVARGVSPLLVTLGALLFVGERPTLQTMAGIGLVSLGLISLARGWMTQATRAGLANALATGALIAAYTVTDGIGGRLSGSPPSYAAWLFVVDALPMPIVYWVLRPRAPLIDSSVQTLKSAAGGVVSLAAYGIVIFAATLAPMGKVSALRETSVVFAALIGWLFLGEDLSLRRLLACVTVGLGALLLG